jgi:hypothetical protein
MAQRRGMLSDPDLCQRVAEAFAAGCSRQQMCEMFNVDSLQTITRWRRDPRVRARALKIIEDRVLQVTRKVDGVIAERLEHADEMSVKDLIMIRKEYLGGALRAQTEKADDDAVIQMMEAMEANPDLDKQIEALLSGKQSIPGALSEEEIDEALVESE